MWKRRLWHALPWPVLAVKFLEQAGFILLFVFLTQRYLIDDRGLGVAFAGYTIAVFGGTKLLSHAPTGWLGDRIGYRRALLMGLSLAVLAIALMAAFPLAWVLLALTALFALGKAPVSPVLDATVAALYGEESRGRVVAVVNASGLAAYAVAGLSSLVALELAPPLAFFALAAGLNAAALVVAAVWLKETAVPALNPAEVTAARPVLGALLNPSVATWAAIVLMVGFGMGMVAPVAQPYVRDVLHMEMRELAPYLLAPAALAAVSIVPAGQLADRLGRIRPLALGLGLGAVGMLGVSFTGGVWPLMGLATLIMLSFTLAAPSMGAALMDITEEGTRGLVLGALSAAAGIGGALGPAVGGRIYDALTPQDVFFTGGFILVGAMLLTMAYGGWRHFAYQPAAVRLDD